MRDEPPGAWYRGSGVFALGRLGRGDPVEPRSKSLKDMLASDGSMKRWMVPKATRIRGDRSVRCDDCSLCLLDLETQRSLSSAETAEGRQAATPR